jgi:branched-chain amino acid transport system ATP-binding protein
MLKVKNIDVYYAKVQALFNVSFEIGKNEIVSIIGANGAGKTTLMKSIMGLNKPRSGSIELNGEPIGGLPPHRIVSKSIVYVPEGREVFSAMTVQENLEMGAYSVSLTKKQLHEKMEEIFSIFPRLKERRKQLAGSLSGGEQQMLAIGRGLISDPKLLMLDEPSLGLAPVVVDDMFDVVVKISRSQKIPVVLVEQNAFMAMSISDRTYVLEVGNIVRNGDSKILMDSPEIKKAYLGG